MRRRLAVWLVGSALLAAVSVLVGCAVTTSTPPAVAAKHVAFPAGTACDAANCHTQHKHEQPYLGPCDKCHNLVDWKQVKYTHNDPTFDNGMHPLVGCATCHTEGQALPTGGCATCHDAPHGGWQGCKSCHTTVAWRLLKPLPTGHVSLEGAHSKLVCQDCHKTATEPAVARTCVSCHADKSPHGAGITTCQNCHDPARGNWTPNPNFNHNTFFQLVGAHTKLQCAQCHKNGKFAGTPRVCVGCHGVHHGGLTDCGACHNRTAFTPATFRHSSVFVLVGQHAKLACTNCHPKRLFARVIGGGSHRCVSCHGVQHGGLTNCASCHTPKGFVPSTFRHSTVFPLIGQHAVLYAQGKCSACHPDGKFAVVPGTHCIDCHGADSPHGASVAQWSCQTCHTPAGFAQVVQPFAQHPITLAGHHAQAACTDCHTSLVFSNTPRGCVVCHGAGGSAAVKVPHVGPSACLNCHTPTTWSDAHFVHPVILNFENTAPAGHDFTSFGPYPTGCAHCHGGSVAALDFTISADTMHTVYCLECHQ